ncbi:MAG: L-dopachrome tautomerase-related protein [Myxococcota bacterium]
MRILLAIVLAACGASSTPPETPTTPEPEPHAELPVEPLTIVAESTRRWTGVTVDASETLYVNFPRWSDDVPISVARLVEGEPIAFPNEAWNQWEGTDPEHHWVCVQSVVVDAQNRLWVLDPGNPKFEGVVECAPKLVRFDLPSTEPAQIIRFAAPSITSGSYLNDVRFDLERNVAFITDSGDGAIVVVDLSTGENRRALDAHPSTEAEDVVLTVGGVTIDRPIHADGIAYDPAGDFLYYQALRARTLYRIPGASLRDATLSEDARGASVERVAESGASDGLLFFQGYVWISALEHDAIRRIRPGSDVETAITDPRIAWPDSFTARAGANHLYFTTAQIHLAEPSAPFRVWRLNL